MTARVRVSGILVRAPESRALKAGRSIATATTATLKAKDGDYARFWRIAAFNEAAQAELLRLSDGDAVAVGGSLKAELYDRNGETELSFGVIAEHVLPLRQPGKKRKTEGRATPQRADATWPPSFLQRECR
jgi:single-stranded DNA-binding protein